MLMCALCLDRSTRSAGEAAAGAACCRGAAFTASVRRACDLSMCEQTAAAEARRVRERDAEGVMCVSVRVSMLSCVTALRAERDQAEAAQRARASAVAATTSSTTSADVSTSSTSAVGATTTTPLSTSVVAQETFAAVTSTAPSTPAASAPPDTDALATPISAAQDEALEWSPSEASSLLARARAATARLEKEVR
jgi:hypothetical protein